MNKIIAEIKSLRYYIAALSALFIVLGIYTFTGSKMTGSTSSEKWSPDGASGRGSSGHSTFHHK